MTPMPTTETQARRAVVAASRQLTAGGLNHGSTGNVSQRWHRGARDGFLITPSAMPAERLTDEDIVWLPVDDDPFLAAASALDGVRKPSSEAPMHRALYQHRGAEAVVHSHATFATTLSCLPTIQRDGIPPFHYMIAMAGGDSIRCSTYATFGTPQLAEAVTRAMVDRLACLIASHGMITIGRDLTRALDLAIEVEHLSRVYWQVLQVGQPVLLQPDEFCQVSQAFSTYGR